MTRNTNVALFATAIVVASVGAYAVQFGILGYQPHLVETEGGYQPVLQEPPEGGYDQTPVMVTDASELTVEQTSRSDSNADGSDYTCISDGRDPGTHSMTTEIVQLNRDRERGDPLYYRMDFNGTVVVENSNREVYIRDFVPPKGDEPGNLILGLREQNAAEPEHDCAGELSFHVGIRFDNDIQNVHYEFFSEVTPPANETATD